MVKHLSLSELKRRLVAAGEQPNFVPKGGQLQHRCQSAPFAGTVVNFWESKNSWNVQGVNSAPLEDALLRVDHPGQCVGQTSSGVSVHAPQRSSAVHRPQTGHTCVSELEPRNTRGDSLKHARADLSSDVQGGTEASVEQSFTQWRKEYQAFCLKRDRERQEQIAALSAAARSIRSDELQDIIKKLLEMQNAVLKDTFAQQVTEGVRMLDEAFYAWKAKRTLEQRRLAMNAKLEQDALREQLRTISEQAEREKWRADLAEAALQQERVASAARLEKRHLSSTRGDLINKRVKLEHDPRLQEFDGDLNKKINQARDSEKIAYSEASEMHRVRMMGNRAAHDPPGAFGTQATQA